MKFNRSIGTFSLLLVALSGMIGSGWLLGPFFAAQTAGPAAILSWLLGGAVMIVVALTFVELSSAFPVTGGTVRFLQMSHGPLVSFTMAWIGWISSAAVAPIETMTLLQYCSNFFPKLVHDIHGTVLLSGFGVGIAGILMFLICLFNIVGIAILTKTNNIVVVAKLFIPVITAVVLLSLHFDVSNLTTAGFFTNGGHGLIAALPLGGVIMSFIGYAPAIQLAGEVKNPQRSLPIAIVGALLIAIVIYMLLQLSYVGAVPHNVLLHHGWNFNGQFAEGPFLHLMTVLHLPWMIKLLVIGATVAPFGTALIYTASTARMAYAMGENGYFPKWFIENNRFGVPMRLVFLNFAIGMFLFLPFPTWQRMVEFLVTALVFAYAVGPLSLLVLRKTKSEQPRPFRLPVAKLMCFLAFYFCNLIIYWTGWGIVSKMLITVGVGYVVLVLYRWTASEPQLSLQWDKAWWIFLYLLLLAGVTYFGSFGGGKHIIPFGWDFLVVALMSGLILFLSQWSVLRRL